MEFEFNKHAMLSIKKWKNDQNDAVAKKKATNI